MKRRDFFAKGGCGVFGLMLAHFGLTSCKKPEEPVEEIVEQAPIQVPAQAEEMMGEMSRVEMVKAMLIEKQGMTEEEAAAKIAEFEKMLPMVQEKCICKTCPTYLADDNGTNGFCHPLIGKSVVITEEKGCDCPKCPIYIEKGMKNGYYCTRKSEMEQEMAKMA